MNRKLIAGLVLAGSSLFAGPRIAVGVGFGAPAPVAPAYVERGYVPPCPGPDYVFVDGYWRHRPVVERREQREHRDGIARHTEMRRDFDRR